MNCRFVRNCNIVITFNNIFNALDYHWQLLHFNEYANREQAVTAQGENLFDIIFPKFKQGGHVVKKVTVNPTYS